MMIEPFLEVDGTEVHLQFTDENSHIMICFDNWAQFDKFMKKLARAVTDTVRKQTDKERLLTTKNGGEMAK